MSWKLAGLVGIDPSERTLRDLLIMAAGAFMPAAQVSAVLLNVNRDPKKQPRPIQPRDCNPFEAKSGGARGIKLTSRNIKLLKAAFVGKKE